LALRLRGMVKRVLVTAALPYVYAPRHFGHLAGAYLPADIYVRYRRLKGDDAIYICGTDENATSVLLEAMRLKISPKELCDRNYIIQKNVFEKLGISFDIYSRTSLPIHFETVEEFYKTLYDKGFIYEKAIKQLFCPKCNTFLPDRFVKGVCPYCEAPDQYGDVCEKCGRWYDAWELKEPKCTICGTKPVLRESLHYFLKLSKLTDSVLQYVKLKGSNWRKATLNKTLSWIMKEGLKDKDITRDYNWGPPAPFPKAKGQVIYNWAENLLGYISSTKHWAIEKNKPEMWMEYWKKADTELYCFIGKDNLFFHTILFPALLIAHGDYILPENVVVSEFVNLEGEKLSTSRGWVIWLHEMLEKFHPDMIRYYAVVIAPEHRDTDFKWKDFQAKVNNELIANLANFVNRVLTLIHKVSGGSVPEPGELDEYDRRMLSEIDKTAERVMLEIEHFEFKKGLKEIMRLSSLGNRYLNSKKPWSNVESAPSTLYVASQIVYAISILLIPYLPFTAIEIRSMLNLHEDLNSVRWDSLKDGLKPGHRISKPKPLFRKVRDEDIAPEIDKLEKLRIKYEAETGPSRAH